MGIRYEGQRARLRPLRRDDLERTRLWRNDPAIRDNTMGFRIPVTREMEDRWYDAAVEDQGRTRIVFAIEDVQDGKLVGFTQLYAVDWISGTAYFGIAIGERDRQGRGIGGEAMELLLGYAFGGLNLRKILLQVPAYNEVAKRLYDRFGFREEGRLHRQVYLDGAYHDVHVMALMREDHLSGD